MAKPRIGYWFCHVAAQIASKNGNIYEMGYLYLYKQFSCFNKLLLYIYTDIRSVER